MNKKGLLRNSLASAVALAAAQGATGQQMPDAPADAGAIEEIVVTAAGYQQNIADAPASITLIPGEELQTRQVRDLADALAMVEGVDVGSPLGKSGGRSISLRGMPAEYTLFLVDGRRQDAAGNVTPNGFDETRTGFMPPAMAIERIEVVRGPMSTLYGADAMGGVVNIITRTPDQTWGGEVKVDSTVQTDDDFGDDYNTTLYLDGPVVPGKAALALRGRHYHRDETRYVYQDQQGNPVEDGGISGGPAVAALDNDSLGARLTLTPARGHRLWFDADANRQVYDNSEGQLGTLGDGGYEDELRFKREQYLAAYTGELWGGILDGDLTRNTTETQGRTLPTDVPGTGRQAGDPRPIEATNTMLNAKYYRSIASHTFTVGGMYWEAEMIEGLSPTPFEHEQIALFAEDEWRLLDPLALTLGARYDDHSVFGSQVSPRAYLVYTATDTLTIKGGVSAGYKAPTLDQLAEGIVGFGGQGTIPLVGTPSLEPETSTNYEVGFHYDNGLGFSANATVFLNDFKDKIARGDGVANCSYGVSEADYAAGNYSTEDCLDVGYFQEGRGGAITHFSQNINIDEAETRGVELATRARLAGGLTLSASYTWTDSEQKSGSSAGEPLTNQPEHRLSTRLNWDATEKLSLWLRGQYHSSRYRGTGRFAGDAQAHLGDYKAFTLFHLGGSYRVNDNLSLSATVYNLLDEDFIDYRSYQTEGRGGPVTNWANTYAIAEEPRRLWLSAVMTF